MFIAESSITTALPPDAIWKVWADVNNWSKWDKDVESCQMDDTFGIGAKAVLKPRGGPRVNIEIIECVANQSFTSRSSLPLCTSLVFEHRIEPVSEGIKITHHVQMRGFLSPLFSLILGRSIRAGLPDALNNLIAIAQKKV